MTFGALLGHFWGTFGALLGLLIIINDEEDDDNTSEDKYYCTFHFNSKDDF